ncbi:MAG: hypothetical protein JWR10_673, partial [Rubritepida sp.]|nr:hypothetical protein [Rubritepida sp.]
MASNLEDLIKQAAAAAESAPAHLQEAAFNQAFSFLSGTQNPQAAPARQQPAAKSRAKAQIDPADEGGFAAMLASIDSSSFPSLNADTPLLNRSLTVLKVAKDEYGLDGLTAPQIATVLTDVLRIKTLRQNVNAVLDEARREVARSRPGRSVLYRIMGDGEKYLAGGSASSARTTKKSRAAAPRQTAKAAETKTKPGGEKAKKPATRRSGRPGPKGALGELIDDGFFAEPRGMPQMIEHLSRTKGHSYKVTDLSPALVRLVREKKLARDRDGSSQYRYRNP